MAKARFVYTPQQSGDDTATSFYCDLALSGWDEDDDPLCVQCKLRRSSPSLIDIAFTAQSTKNANHDLANYVHFSTHN